MNAILFPVFDFFAKNKWAQLILLVVTGLIVIRILLWIYEEYIRKDEAEKWKLARERQVASQREETSQRVEAFNEAARVIERLPDDELFERTETDPNRRGVVRRD